MSSGLPTESPDLLRRFAMSDGEPVMAGVPRDACNERRRVVDHDRMRIAEHWVATTRGGERLLDPRRARWLFERLRANFPHALSLVLMPDHLHLVVAGTGALVRLRRVLAMFTSSFGVRGGGRSVCAIGVEGVECVRP